MKIRFYFSALFVCLLLASSVQAQAVLKLNGSSGQTDDLTLIEFEKETYDLGTFQAGEFVKGSFVFKNIGDGDLLIENVKPSCACATLEYPEDVIKPGGTGIIYAEIDTADKEGEQIKYFTVIYNGNPPVERVKLIFTVEPAE
jgi:hypothetical protein